MADRKGQDRILLEGLSFYGFHGVRPEERTLGQQFLVDLSVYLDLSKPGDSDLLSDTISYTDLYQTVKAVVQDETYNLLEAVAQTIATRVLASFPVEAVWTRVTKLSPPIAGVISKGASVEIYRAKS